MKKITILLTLLISLAALSGCGSNDKKVSDAPKDAVPAVLKIGVTAGPHAEIMDNVKKLAEKQGLKLEIVEFSDYVSPNVALFQGELFANSMQHAPYLQATLKKEPKFDLKECFKTVNFPMAVYSKKIKKGETIPDGAIIAIPNDPSNGGRALLLLANAGIIKVKDINNVTTSVADITENTHNFKFRELDAATIPRSMDDVTVAVINANYALPAGLNPTNDSILLESAKNPFVNIFVTKDKNLKSEQIAKLKAIYQSPENEKFILEHFKGTILPAWK
jgi:D-methionine transport system substrate-binding protein